MPVSDQEALFAHLALFKGEQMGVILLFVGSNNFEKFFNPDKGLPD